MDCVLENSTHGSVSGAEKVPSCAHCVVFACRLVPDQWEDKRFRLDIVKIFFAIGNGVNRWKGLPREVVESHHLWCLEWFEEQLKAALSAMD